MMSCQVFFNILPFFTVSFCQLISDKSLASKRKALNSLFFQQLPVSSAIQTDSNSLMKIHTILSQSHSLNHLLQNNNRKIFLKVKQLQVLFSPKRTLSKSFLTNVIIVLQMRNLTTGTKETESFEYGLYSSREQR